jgi:hypothetical protein
LPEPKGQNTSAVVGKRLCVQLVENGVNPVRYCLRVKDAIALRLKEQAHRVDFRGAQIDFRPPFKEPSLLVVELIRIQTYEIRQDSAKRTPIVQEGENDRTDRTTFRDDPQGSLVEFGSAFRSGL